MAVHPEPEPEIQGSTESVDRHASTTTDPPRTSPAPSLEPIDGPEPSARPVQETQAIPAGDLGRGGHNGPRPTPPPPPHPQTPIAPDLCVRPRVGLRQ